MDRKGHTEHHQRRARPIASARRLPLKGCKREWPSCSLKRARFEFFFFSSFFFSFFFSSLFFFPSLPSVAVILLPPLPPPPSFVSSVADLFPPFPSATNSSSCPALSRVEAGPCHGSRRATGAKAQKRKKQRSVGQSRAKI